MLIAGGILSAALPLMADTEQVGNYTWYYRINGETAEITDDGGELFSRAIRPEPTGAVTVPAALGGYPVTSIGLWAFCHSGGLTSVTIPNSVTNIVYEAFYGCSGLTSVHIADLAAWCRISFGDSYANPLYYAHNLYLNGTLVTNLVIPVGVTIIGDLAFSGCSGLTSVTIPNSVTSIGQYAFYNCSGLTSVTIPDSVTDLSETAFDGCGKLWTAWYRTLANSSASGGGSVLGADPRYALSSVAADRAIASVTVDSDTAIDSFVLTDGKVYDTALYVVNSSASEVHLSLPGGYVYVTPKGKTPLALPANSMNLLTITRLAERTFLVSRQLLEIVK